MSFIINALRGFCMALADSVPGVSGGTIAFILGFYDNFVNSLNDLIYGKKEDKKTALKFLIKLMSGWVIGMAVASIVLASLFEKEIYRISSLFLGFIIFAIPLIAKQEKEQLKGKYINIIFTLIGITIVALITYFNPVSGSEGNAVDLTNISLGLGIYVFLVGMVAISAMILPGISGSTLLLIFGIYIPIISAVKEILHLNLNYLPILMVFGTGIITGVLLIIKLVKKALEKFRSQTIYTILGLMLGSLYAIVMGPTTLENPQAPLGLHTFSIIFFIIGAAVILGLEFIQNKLKDKIKE